MLSSCRENVNKTYTFRYQMMRIVSSEHLLSPKTPELSECEYGLIVAWHAFARWMTRCAAAAGAPDLTPVDILVLHHVAHRRSDKRVPDICSVLDIEDTHVVTYSLRKLTRAGFVTSRHHGKEALYRITDAGWSWCQKYRQVRDACLIPIFSGNATENAELARTAEMLRTLSGRYDQAARAATTTPPAPDEQR